MAFWDDLSQNITGTGRILAGRAKELTDTLQLKAQIANEKAKIKDYYAAIGKAYFDDHKNDSDSEYLPTITAIKETMEKIAFLEQEIENINETR